MVIDLCVYDRMFDSDILGPFGDGFARLERWVVNPASRTMSTTVIDADRSEFPRHRGSLTGKPYRYGYCARARVLDVMGSMTAGRASPVPDSALCPKWPGIVQRPFGRSGVTEGLLPR